MKIVLLAPFHPDRPNKGLTVEENMILNNYIIPVYKALKDLGHAVNVETNPLNLFGLCNKVDLVFSLYTRIGFKNYETLVSNICSFLEICCNGSSFNIKALAEDKVFSKIYAKNLGVKTLDWFELYYQSEIVEEDKLPFHAPYFIKPRNSGASIGINNKSLCKDYLSLRKQFKFISKFKMNSIVEPYIKGAMITVPIIKVEHSIYYTAYQLETNEPSGIISHEIKKGLNKEYYCIRSTPNAEIATSAINITLKMFDALNDCGYARFDFLHDAATNELFFLEFNTCPNIQENSGFYASIKDKYNLSYKDFIELIIKSCF